jgi:hypothetical protein
MVESWLFTKTELKKKCGQTARASFDSPMVTSSAHLEEKVQLAL